MKILHINTQDIGGAANACIRLHQGLLELGVDSKLLVLNQYNKSLPYNYQYLSPPPDKFAKFSKNTKRILRALHLYSKGNKFDKRKYLQNRPKGFEIFSFPDTPFDITNHPLYKEADIINLHWVAGFLDYTSFFRNNSKKIVWTLHDMNPFTGGCHYSGDCKGFESNCNLCPQLLNTIAPDYSNKILQTKINAINTKTNITLVFPSTWLLKESEKSILFSKFPHFKIPYGLKADVFKPYDKKFSRELLGLPQNKKVILFVADSLSNKRKGYEYLMSAIEHLKNNEEVILCAIGSDSIGKNNIFELGQITDDRVMSSAYSAADVFVLPSLEDNLPNTVLESLMCGTPVIGFPIGGMVDMIEDSINGYLCDTISVSALTVTIEKFLGNPDFFNKDKIRKGAIKKYDLRIQAEAYIALYKKLMNP